MNVFSQKVREHKIVKLAESLVKVVFFHLFEFWDQFLAFQTFVCLVFIFTYD